MKINLKQPIKNFEGDPVISTGGKIIVGFIEDSANVVKEVAGESVRDEYLENIRAEMLQRPLTVGEVIRDLCSRAAEDLSRQEKDQRFQLGIRCVADEVEFDDEDRVFIKKLVGDSTYSPVVYGRIAEIFDG